MSLVKTGDQTRTELALIRTGLASWGMALFLLQHPHGHWTWLLFFLLGVWSIWRARDSIL